MRIKCQGKILKSLFFIMGAIFASSAAHAVCPAAPVGAPDEQVIQMKNLANGTAAWAATNQVSATVEGSLVWDDANDAIAYCDGTNWVTLDGGDNLGSHIAGQNLAMGQYQIDYTIQAGENTLINMLGDGFKIKRNENFFSANADALVFEKTDFNNLDPDGGIAFTNTGSDGVSETSMVIRGSGNVGIGTNSPSSTLHIKGSTLLGSSMTLESFTDVALSSGAISFYRSRGSAAAPAAVQDGDSLGLINFHGHAGDKTRAGPLIKAVAENNWTISSRKAGIAFFTQPSSERMRLSDSGYLGIGTTNPTNILHVNGVALADGWNVPSDKRLKSNIVQIGNALDQIIRLTGTSFVYTEDNRASLGLIAQDVEKVFPMAVTTNAESTMKSVDYNQLIAPLIEAVKELSSRNKALEMRIEMLEDER